MFSREGNLAVILRFKMDSPKAQKHPTWPKTGDFKSGGNAHSHEKMQRDFLNYKIGRGRMKKATYRIKEPG